jgi:hypothetical protein
VDSPLSLLKTVNYRESLEILLRDRRTVGRLDYHSVRYRFFALGPLSRPSSTGARELGQIEASRRKGLTTLRAIAAEFEPLQVKTPRAGRRAVLHTDRQYPQARERVWAAVLLVFDWLFRRLKRTVHHHRPIHGRRWLRDR